jgi:hypothetical protein
MKEISENETKAAASKDNSEIDKWLYTYLKKYAEKWLTKF